MGSVFTRRCLVGTSRSTIARTPRSSSSSGRRPIARAEDAVAPGVERLDARTEAGQPRRHLLLGLLVVGERDARFALVAAIGQQVAVALREHAGLAGAGRRDDPGRTGPMGNRLELVGAPTRRSGAPAPAAASAGRSRRSRGGRSPRPRAGPRAARRGPPSTHAGVPSGSTTSASPPSVAPSRTALRDHHQIGSPSPRAS